MLPEISLIRAKRLLAPSFITATKIKQTNSHITSFIIFYVFIIKIMILLLFINLNEFIEHLFLYHIRH